MAGSSMAQPQAAEARRIHGMVVMTLQGDLVWSVWLNNGVPISVAKLCQTVASFFANEAQNQNSSYLEAGSFAAASTLDFDTIVTILCPKSVLETEALLKAREVSHALKLLCGPELQQVVRLVGQHPGDPAPGEDGYLMRMVTMFLRSTRCSLPPHTKEWLDDHTQPHDVAQFLTAKLQSVSPCSDAFATLQQAPGFIGAHFLDLTEPGEVLLSHWLPNGSHAGGPSTAKKGKSFSRVVRNLLGPAPTIASSGSLSRSRSLPRVTPAVLSSIQQLMARQVSSLWTHILREARDLCLQSAQGRRTVIVGAGGSRAATCDTCSIDLSALVADVAASIRLVKLQHYEAAFVVLYLVPGGLVRPNQASRAAAAFQVLQGDAGVPPDVLSCLKHACDDVMARFPVTRSQQLAQVWPRIPLSDPVLASSTSVPAPQPATTTSVPAAASKSGTQTAKQHSASAPAMPGAISEPTGVSSAFDAETADEFEGEDADFIQAVDWPAVLPTNRSVAATTSSVAALDQQCNPSATAAMVVVAAADSQSSSSASTIRPPEASATSVTTKPSTTSIATVGSAASPSHIPSAPTCTTPPKAREAEQSAATPAAASAAAAQTASKLETHVTSPIPSAGSGEQRKSQIPTMPNSSASNKLGARLLGFFSGGRPGSPSGVRPVASTGVSPSPSAVAPAPGSRVQVSTQPREAPLGPGQASVKSQQPTCSPFSSEVPDVRVGGAELMSSANFATASANGAAIASPDSGLHFTKAAADATAAQAPLTSSLAVAQSTGVKTQLQAQPSVTVPASGNQGKSFSSVAILETAPAVAKQMQSSWKDNEARQLEAGPLHGTVALAETPSELDSELEGLEQSYQQDLLRSRSVTSNHVQGGQARTAVTAPTSIVPSTQQIATTITTTTNTSPRSSQAAAHARSGTGLRHSTSSTLGNLLKNAAPRHASSSQTLGPSDTKPPALASQLLSRGRPDEDSDIPGQPRQIYTKPPQRALNQGNAVAEPLEAPRFRDPHTTALAAVEGISCVHRGESSAATVSSYPALNATCTGNTTAAQTTHSLHGQPSDFGDQVSHPTGVSAVLQPKLAGLKCADVQPAAPLQGILGPSKITSNAAKHGLQTVINSSKHQHLHNHVRNESHATEQQPSLLEQSNRLSVLGADLPLQRVSARPRPPLQPPAQRPASPNLWRRQAEGTHIMSGRALHQRLSQLAAGQADSGDENNSSDVWQHHRNAAWGGDQHRRGEQETQMHSSMTQRQRRHRHGSTWASPAAQRHPNRAGSASRRVLTMAANSTLLPPSASQLLSGSLMREEERHWRLFLMQENTGLRKALEASTAAMHQQASSAGRLHAETWAGLDPSYRSPPPHIYWPPVPPAAAALAAGGAVTLGHSLSPWVASLPNFTATACHADPVGTRTETVRQAAVAAGAAAAQLHPGAHSSPAAVAASTPPGPSILLAPPAVQPSPEPYRIWQMFNGVWYRLIGSGEWVPSASPPHGVSTARGGQQLQGGGVVARDTPVSPTRSASSTLPPTLDSSTLDAIVQGIARQLWQRLQTLMPAAAGGGGAASGLPGGSQPDPGIAPDIAPSSDQGHQASTGLGRQSIRGTHGSVSPGSDGKSGAVHDGVNAVLPRPGEMQYYRTAGGELYCRNPSGAWFRVEAADISGGMNGAHTLPVPAVSG